VSVAVPVVPAVPVEGVVLLGVAVCPVLSVPVGVVVVVVLCEGVAVVVLVAPV